MPRRPRPKQDHLVKAIGARLARLRKERGLTQAQLAHELGVSQVNVSAYERGTLRLPSDLLARAAGALQGSADELLGLSLPKRGEHVKLPSTRMRRRLQMLENLPRRDQDALSRLLSVFEGKAEERRKQRSRQDSTDVELTGEP